MGFQCEAKHVQLLYPPLPCFLWKPIDFSGYPQQNWNKNRAWVEGCYYGNCVDRNGLATSGGLGKIKSFFLEKGEPVGNAWNKGCAEIGRGHSLPGTGKFRVVLAKTHLYWWDSLLGRRVSMAAIPPDQDFSSTFSCCNTEALKMTGGLLVNHPRSKL